ncbi:MAG: NUDIX domain-containing protein [Granulosicoccaceae bacterium]
MERKGNHKWRPQTGIQVKVLGICMNKGKLLAMDVFNDKGLVKGVRPLGGTVEPGETRETALAREFAEELDTEIVVTGNWRVFENIYLHEGMLGHEYCFATGVSLVDKSLYTKSVIAFSEDSGAECRATWVDIKNLKAGELELFPDGLLAAL